MKDLSTKNVIVKEEKESSESENESKNSSSDNEENVVKWHRMAETGKSPLGLYWVYVCVQCA